MDGRLIPDHRVRVAVRALILASVLSLIMLAGRIVFSHRLSMGFYVWNLILAWLPLIFALRVYQLIGERPARRWPLSVCAILWFLFFPNAPYMVTDFLHLFGRQPVPQWFDIVMMMSFAWTGLLLGYLSLMLMQETVRARHGSRWGWAFAITMLMLGTLGIYLGRFARWNSWDVLLRPNGLLGQVNHHPALKPNPEMAAFMVTFLCFSLLSYATLYSLTHLRHHEPSPPTLPPEPSADA